jgi:hypothetical protein
MWNGLALTARTYTMPGYLKPRSKWYFGIVAEKMIGDRAVESSSNGRGNRCIDLCSNQLIDELKPPGIVSEDPQLGELS